MVKYGLVNAKNAKYYEEEEENTLEHIQHQPLDLTDMPSPKHYPRQFRPQPPPP